MSFAVLLALSACDAGACGRALRRRGAHLAVGDPTAAGGAGEVTFSPVP